MTLFSKQNIKKELEESGARPLKSLGQNFLINQKVLTQIVNSANLSKKDVVIEIGAGFGNLTVSLSKKAKKVIAFEIDKKLTEILKKNAQNIKNIEIFNQDIRKIDLDRVVMKKPYKIIANIPYYLTSFLLRKLFSLKNRPKIILFLVQKEVARRIIARPPKMNLLALNAQMHSQVKILKEVKKGNFWPRPDIDSTLIMFKTKKEKEIDCLNPEILLKLAKIGFSNKRKQLKNNLKKALKLDEKIVLEALKNASLNEKVRPEELSLENWQKLTFYLLKS